MSVEAAIIALKSAASVEKPCLRWSLVDQEVGPWSSQIGGSGWTPRGEAAPMGADGQPFVFVAQMAVSDIPAPFQSPALTDGVIQLFLDGDRMACAFPSVGNGNGFVVRHVPASADLVALPEGEPWDALQWPANETRAKALVPIETTMPPSAEDVSIQRAVQAVYAAVRASGFEGQPWEHPLVKNTMDSLYDREDSGFAAHTGGFPGFTQGDPRARDSALSEHTFVVLNLGYSPDICISDAGELHILVTPEAWARGDFSGAIYNWDCR
jgi:uncharacterized protein YwqG